MPPSPPLALSPVRLDDKPPRVLVKPNRRRLELPDLHVQEHGQSALRVVRFSGRGRGRGRVHVRVGVGVGVRELS